MAWYYYSGRIVHSVPVSSTKSVAVRPNSKVEILEVTAEVQAMMNAGLLKRTGRPVGAPSLGDSPLRPAVRMRDVLQPSALAQAVAEKGLTTSASLPPQRTSGSPEFTVHERAAEGPPAEAAVLPDEAVEDGLKRSKRRRDHQ